ncbi:MAG: transcriptional repressor LexA [Sandaracinaceae bacterium]|nr:transcriptional repressor LexA [Sandaracinaceae bacterium]
MALPLKLPPLLPEGGELTLRQRQVLQFIVDTCESRGYPPSVREIMAALNLRSTNGVSDHLIALSRKGYIIRDSHKSRAIQPTEKAYMVLRKGPVAVRADRVVQTNSSERNEEKDGVVEVPLLGRVAAGPLGEAIEHKEALIRVDASLLGLGKGKKGIFALRVRGESMIGAGIQEGDIVFVDTRREVKEGEIVVARFRGEATLKYYHQEEGGVRLEAAHPSYAPVIIRPGEEDDFAIVGVVIGFYRRLR